MKDKYIDYLKYEKRYSEYTVDGYLKDIEFFLDFLSSKKIDYLKIDKDEIRDYLRHLDNLKYEASSISRMLSSLRGFYQFLVINNKIENNPFKRIHNPKKGKRLPNFLSYNEFVELLNSLLEDNILDIRNGAIMEMLYASGLRVSELVDLKLNDINFSDKSIKVVGKGNKERVVYFGEYALDSLNNYLNNSRKILLDGKSSEYVWLNKNGNKISVRGVQLIIDNISKRAMLKHKISPHVFRHTFATSLLNEGADIRSVQELLGHSSLSTTQIYTHVTNDKLRSEYLKAFPRK